ncbi:PA14 domain-containing protein [Hymenobacter sp. HDW8]|uniref:PA14 domain-containing protein n=1 Tax=Hymenobacter sp. HDW8 TaxID=2714932 RepID=UPI0014072FE7|nr:PA14 domain-containing protein [Hymenobacter sp. HDW8]QIL74827.1 OmpA family protein [Hymenobacter sp. HDW8]
MGNGLKAVYYRGENFEEPIHTRIDPVIDFDWKEESPAPGVPADHFSVRWTGRIYAPATGVYTFRIIADDGMRVWVGGRQLMEEWRPQQAFVATARVRLTGGKYYSIRVDYYQEGIETRAFLGWDLPGQEAAFSPDDLTREGRSRTGFFGKPVATLVPVQRRFLFTPVPSVVRPLVAKPAKSKLPEPEKVEKTKVTVSKAVVATPKPPPQRPVRRVVKPIPVLPRPTPAPPLVSVPAPTLPSDSLLTLAALPVGTIVPLHQLYFTRGTANLLPSSRPELTRLVRALQAQPKLNLEIRGHTDNVGDSILNRRLSVQRARVVRAYLVQRGIDSLRLTTQGYGGTRPVADNQDPNQRPRNRRVEVVRR